jgi:hypothetical protein
MPARSLLLQSGTDAQNGDYSLLHKTARSAEREVVWSTLKDTSQGDEAWFYVGAPHSAIVAVGVALDDAKPGEEWAFTAQFGELRWVEPPITLEDLRVTFPDWGWAKGARGRAYLPDEVAEYLRGRASQGMLQRSAATENLDHYVAYHSVEVMGNDYSGSPEGRFSYYSRKPESQLRRALGALVWLVIGSPTSGQRTEYSLAGVYTATTLVADGDGWIVEGWGTALLPRPILNGLPWFPGFLRTQANFSLGFNRLSDQAIVEAFGALIGRDESTLGDDGSRYVDPEAGFDPVSVVDARERVIASIVRRRGQPEFRARLLSAYGSRCAFSGCTIESILDAAHIVPYQGDQTNHPQNGMLLRTDLHTLFDLGLLAVDAASMTILIAPVLAGSEYERLAGQKLEGPLEASLAPSKAALEQHRLKAVSVMRGR